MINNDAFLSLLQKHIDTWTETTASRGKDFRDVYVDSLVTLVKKAYEAGREDGFETALEQSEKVMH
jgi:hypothetical protein